MTRSNPEAKIIAHSISSEGKEIITMEVKMHRFILAEFNTHRVFSRNSASSRAIPASKIRQMVIEDPAYPLWWGKNQAGMQAREELSEPEIEQVKSHWRHLRDQAVDTHLQLEKAGLHKQVLNRILEPWLWHRVIVTSTEWDNFLWQRVHPDAQPEMGMGNTRTGIYGCAKIMWEAIKKSNPTIMETGRGDLHRAWHLPYVTSQERSELPLITLQAVSVARCARVSYLTHDGRPDISKDIELYAKLINQRPGHWSPLEHVATPCKEYDSALYCGNFQGWRQFRKLIEPQVGKFKDEQ